MLQQQNLLLSAVLQCMLYTNKYKITIFQHINGITGIMLYILIVSFPDSGKTMKEPCIQNNELTHVVSKLMKTLVQMNSGTSNEQNIVKMLVVFVYESYKSAIAAARIVPDTDCRT